MAQHHLIVISRSNNGQSAEFERWYDDVHLSDVCKIPCVSAAQRLRIRPLGGPNSDGPGWESLAIYDFEGDPAALLEELGARAGSADMPISDAMASNVLAFTAEPTKTVKG